jgi:hypothetical protein
VESVSEPGGRDCEDGMERIITEEGAGDVEDVGGGDRI